MTDMIETVARAVALAANDYEGPDLQWHGWTDIAQAAITAHTAALIAGAGELCERLTKQMCNHRSEDLCGCPLCAALSEAAATIAALRAELARAKEEGVRLGIDAAKVSLNTAKGVNKAALWDVNHILGRIDPAAIIRRTTAMDELIAADAHLIDGEPQ